MIPEKYRPSPSLMMCFLLAVLATSSSVMKIYEGVLTFTDILLNVFVIFTPTMSYYLNNWWMKRCRDSFTTGYETGYSEGSESKRRNIEHLDQISEIAFKRGYALGVYETKANTVKVDLSGLELNGNDQ